MAHWITDANKNRIKVAGNYGISPNTINSNMLGVPSNRYIDISGTTYTAPANGWVTVRANGNNLTGNKFCIIENQTNGLWIRETVTANGTPLSILMPVKKGDIVNLTQTNINELIYFRFYYAEEV